MMFDLPNEKLSSQIYRDWTSLMNILGTTLITSQKRSLAKSSSARVKDKAHPALAKRGLRYTKMRQ